MHGRIEKIDEHNLPYACSMFKELHGLSDLRRFPFDESYNRALTAHRMHDPAWWGYLARDLDDTEYVGVMVGSVQTALFSLARIGFEHGMYVRAGTRFRLATALHLVNSFVAWCYYAHNCIMVQSGDIASINGQATHVLYRRAGFRPYGAIYSHERGAAHVE